MVESVAPMFPCYLFAKFDFEGQWANIRYTRGLRDVVHFGDRPAVLDEWIAEELARRSAHGPIELPKHEFAPGDRVVVVDGPLREFEGMFEQRLSGSERVAILLSIMGRSARTVLPSQMIAAVA